MCERKRMPELTEIAFGIRRIRVQWLTFRAISASAELLVLVCAQ